MLYNYSSVPLEIVSRLNILKLRNMGKIKCRFCFLKVGEREAKYLSWKALRAQLKNERVPSCPFFSNSYRFINFKTAIEMGKIFFFSRIPTESELFPFVEIWINTEFHFGVKLSSVDLLPTDKLLNVANWICSQMVRSTSLEKKKLFKGTGHFFETLSLGSMHDSDYS